MAQRDRPIEVTWEDAASGAGWKDRDEAEHWATDGFMVTSVGYVVRRTPAALTIAQSRTVRGGGAGDQLDHLLRIPRGMVKKVRRL